MALSHEYRRRALNEPSSKTRRRVGGVKIMASLDVTREGEPESLNDGRLFALLIR